MCARSSHRRNRTAAGGPVRLRQFASHQDHADRHCRNQFGDVVELATIGTSRLPPPTSGVYADSEGDAPASADGMRCLGAMAQFATLRDGPLMGIADTSPLDYPTLSAAVSGFAANMHAQSPGFTNVALQLAWERVGVNGDAAAQALLEGDAP